jgi:hypothetical protein
MKRLIEGRELMGLLKRGMERLWGWAVLRVRQVG